MSVGEPLVVIFEKAVATNASDIHVKGNVKDAYTEIAFRVNGLLIRASGKFPINTFMELKESVKRLTGTDLSHPDFAVEVNVNGKTIRARGNYFKHLKGEGFVFRLIRESVPTIEELKLPQECKKVIGYASGLVLVTGPTGSGKTTTLFSLLQEVNKNFKKVIITIEDPIEYVLKDEKSFIYQVEKDPNKPFSYYLKNALRQNPDVILVGEMRDRETIELALQASETGHLVLSTLHTKNAVEALTRIVAAFPQEEQTVVRKILSNVLRVVFNQRLVPKKDRSGVVPAVEILTNVGKIKELIESGRFTDVWQVMERSPDCKTLDASLLELYKAGLISKEAVLSYAQSTVNVERALRGIE